MKPRSVRVFLVVLLGIEVGADSFKVVDFVLGSHRKEGWFIVIYVSGD